MTPYGINLCEGCYQRPCQCEELEARQAESEWAPAFGEWFTGIYASDDNPQKHGMYVRTIDRPHGRMNPGTFYELTDGEGRFWEYPIESVVRKEANRG